MQNDVFISYSHAADGRLAPALQGAMQRLAKPWYRPRALRVFRDESALSANPHLWSSIQSALDQSEWFLLLASPEAAASEWVNRELVYWLEHKSADRILPVITDGTWHWDASSRRLTGTAVLPALETAFPDEPRHVDLVWAHDAVDLDLRNSRFRDAVAQLAAPAHGVPKDDLEGEDIRLHRRAQRLARGGVTVLVLLVVIALVTSGFALVQRRNANRSAGTARSERDRANAERFAALATAKRASAPDEALLLAVEGYERGNSPTTRAALLGAVSATPQLIGFFPGAHDATTSALSPDGKTVAVGTPDGSVRLWSPDGAGAATDAAAPAAVRGQRVVAMTFDPAGKRLYTLYPDGRVQTWDVARRMALGQPFGVGKPGAQAIAASPDGRTIAVTGLGTPEVGDLGQRSRLYDVVAHRAAGSVAGAYDVAFSADGRTIYAWDRVGPHAFDVRTKQPVGRQLLNSPGVAGNVAAGTNALGQQFVVAGASPNGCFTAALCGASLIDANTAAAPVPIISDVTANAVAMSRDAAVVAIGGTDGSVTLWAPPNSSLPPLNDLAAPSVSANAISLAPPLHHPSSVVKVSLSSNGERLASTSVDGTTLVWDLTGGSGLARGPDTTADEQLYTLSADGSRVAGAGNAEAAWHAEHDGTFTRDLVHRAAPQRGNTGRITGSNLSRYALVIPNTGIPGVSGGNLLIPSINEKPLTDPIPVVDRLTGRSVGEIDPATAADAMKRAHANDGLAQFSPIWIRTRDGTGQVAVDPTGRYAATFSFFGDLVVWNLRTHGPVAPPVISQVGSRPDVTAVAFSSDGKELAAGRQDGTIVRYSVPSMRQIGATLRSRTAGIGQLAYQPNGSLLAAASAEGVDLIDVVAGTTVPLVSFNNPGAFSGSYTFPAGTVQWDASGRELLTYGYVPTRGALLWSMRPSDWVQAACRAAGRNLSHDEWTQIVGSDVPYHRTCAQWPAS